MGRALSGRALAFIGAALVTAAFAAPARAGEAISLRPPVGIGGDEARADARWLGGPSGRVLPPLDEKSIVLDLGRIAFRASGDAGFVGEVAPIVNPHVVYDFSGIPCILYHQVMAYYRQAFSDEVLQHWITGNMTVMQLERAREWFANELNDCRTGRWWDRTWRESLTVERGGVPAGSQVVEIGHEIQVFRIGEFGLTNEGRVVAPADVSVYVPDSLYSRIPSARSLERETASAAVRRDPIETHPMARLPRSFDGGPPGSRVGSDDDRLACFVQDEVRIDLERSLHGAARAHYARALDASVLVPTPSGNLYTGEGWNLNGRFTLIPKAQLGIPVSYVSAQLEVGLYPGFARDHWATLHLRVKAQPGSGIVSVQCDFEVLSW